MTDYTHDIIVVGGGTAGLVTAAGATLLGARTALVERTALGGECLWSACVPSKALIAVARDQHAGGAAAGAVGRGPPPGDGGERWRGAVAWLRAARERIAPRDDAARFRAMGVDVVLAPAHLAGGGRVETAERPLRAKRIVIATGAIPETPPLPGLTAAGFLTHLTAYDQTALPESIVIVGGGPTGLEFAQTYARFGARVSVVEREHEILPREDREVARFVRERLAEEGIEVFTQFHAADVHHEDGAKTVIAADGRRVRAAEIFVAAGRRPASGGLALERAGVDLDERGAVRVNDRLATTGRGVWAAGDVTGGLQFTHVADYQARTAVRNALTPFPAKVRYAAIPWVTFTDPEIARVGLTAAEAEVRGLRPRVYQATFEAVDRAIIDGVSAGFAKVVAGPNGRLLGATIVGRGAGELITTFVLGLRYRLRLKDLDAIVFPYPTMSEIAKKSIDAYNRARLDGPAGRWLRRIVRSWL